MTAVECRNGRWFKRDDLHRDPATGVNGGKWRQCEWLIRGYAADGAPGIITGASVLSPQIPMTARAAQMVGLPCRIVVGGTTPEKAARHPGPALAARLGAVIESTPVGYNPALQKAVRERAGRDAILHYGVTPEPGASAGRLAAFHDLGAREAEALPAPVRHLVVPFGSGNSAASILFGLARHPNPPDLVTLVGIGPDRSGFLEARLRLLEAHTGVPAWSAVGRAYRLRRFDLHAAGVVTYGRKQPRTQDGIVLHPTYEGKVATWMWGEPGLFPGWVDGDGTTCLWIVGGPVG